MRRHRYKWFFWGGWLIIALILAACGRNTSATSESSVTVAAPDFVIEPYQSARTLGSGQTSFARVFDQRKPVILNFWAGLCPPCRAEMPAFQAVADDYADDLIVLGVDVGPFTGLGSAEDARALLKELQITYPAGAATGVEALQLYEVRGMPTTIFFAPDGTMLAQHTGFLSESHLRDLVNSLLLPFAHTSSNGAL